MTKLRRIMDDKQPTIERWKPVKGYEGIYEASSHGRIRSVDRVVTYSDGRVRRCRGKVLRTHLDRYGYEVVGLCNQGRQKTRTVHSLVAEAFIGARPEGMEVCHNDGSKTNNHLGNLRFDTQSENAFDRVKHGTHNNAVKTQCPRGHELFAENIPPSSAKRGYRNCLACDRASAYVYRHPELKPQLEALAGSYYKAILNNRKIAA